MTDARLRAAVAVFAAAGAAVALATLAFSVYLLVVQLAVIGAVCEWCLASEAIAALLAPAAALRIVQ